MKVFFTLPDKEKDYQSHMVYVLTIIWSVTIAVVVTATWAMFPGLWQRYLLFFSVAVFIWAFNLSINRWVSTQLASWTLPITCWLIVSLSCYTAGGIQSPHIITQLVVILTAAYLLGWRGGLAFGLLSAAIDFLYAWMASEGTLPEPTIVHTPLSRWVGALIPFGTLLVLQHYATNHLRSSLAATKREIEKRTEAEKEKDITLNNLGERVKELQTLYTVGNMLQDEIITLDKLVKQVAETLPPGWQYPEITAVRVCMAGKEYRTANYKSTPHSLQAETKTSKNTKVGIEVVYLDEMPQLDEGPFLKEERNLLNMLVDMLKVYLERRERTSELFDYKFALDKAAIVGISDVEGRFIYTNDNFTKASKYNRSELSGIHHSVIWSGYHPPGYFDELKIAMQDGKPFKGEFCNKAKDGSLYWVESTIVPFLDEDGKVYQYLSINYDITERKKIEEEIKASEEKFRNLVEQAGDAIFIIDPDVALLTEVNIAASKLLGYTREELLSLSYDQVFFPEDIAQNPLRFSKLSKERTSMVTERKMRRKDGTEVYTEINTGLLQGNNFICIVRDITERREAEEKLRRSEEMNRAMIENMQDGLLLLDSELKALYQSPSGERITGYTSEERLNGTSGLMAYPDDAERVKNILQNTLDSPNVPVHFESRAIHKSGKVVWLENTAINLLDNPSIGAVMINYSDVTERKKATEMFRHQFENSPDIILIVNREFKIESINRTRTGEINPPEFIGKDSVEVLPEESRKIARESIIRCFETGENIEIENSLSGNRWVRSRFVPIRIDGHINTIMVIATDITEQRNAEKQLRQNEERNRALIENISEAIVLIDANEKIIFQSPAVVRITGYTQEETVGVASFSFIHPDEVTAFRQFLQEVINSPGVPLQSMFRIIHKNGHTVWLEGTLVNMLHNESINGIVVNYGDVTERVNAEKEKQEIQERTMAMLEDKVAERTEELYRMNTVLEHRNHEITDSINYAENIQRAILSKYEDCTRLFPQSFVLWMPKDVVSGDFYWCYSTKKYDFIAVVDCTGHGVPGALMSIIANQMLGKVVGSHGFVEPKDILFHLDDAIISSLHQENGLVKDGMDMALCRVDKEKKELLFAGAQRPLYYHNGNELSEISGSKSGIGGFVSGSDLKIFSQTTIQYKQGDSFYLTSDGYYSQFGGEKGKKMMKKRFFELVSDIAGKPVSEQPELLRDYYIDWQNNEEQTDDVLVIGVRL